MSKITTFIEIASKLDDKEGILYILDLLYLCLHLKDIEFSAF